MDKFDPNEHLVMLKTKNGPKEYLPVAWRLVWFRKEHTNWKIDTALVELDKENNQAMFQCKICDENGNQISCGYGSETVKDFADYIEKAETKAVGRALAMLGYGTQFAPELDEAERVVDAPQPTKITADKPQIVPCDECGLGIPRDIAVSTYKLYGKKLCSACAKTIQKKEMARVLV